MLSLKITNARIKELSNEHGCEFKIIPGFYPSLASENGDVCIVRESSVYFYKQHIRENGYLQVGIFTDSKIRKTVKVHRLVGLAFGIIKPHEMINHIDGDKTNNRLSNLEKTTWSENMKHAIRTGLLINPTCENHRSTRLVRDDIRKIKLMAEYGLTTVQISEVYNMSSNSVSDILKGKTWSRLDALTGDGE